MTGPTSLTLEMTPTGAAECQIDAITFVTRESTRKETQ